MWQLGQILSCVCRLTSHSVHPVFAILHFPYSRRSACALTAICAQKRLTMARQCKNRIGRQRSCPHHKSGVRSIAVQLVLKCTMVVLQIPPASSSCSCSHALLFDLTQSSADLSMIQEPETNTLMS